MEYIELPKDAEGREIPRNTEVMYDINGKKVHITSFTYHCDVFGHFAQWKVFSQDITGEKDGMLPADSLYLTPPDSWEKLYGDIDKCVVENSICMYFSKEGTCKSCALRNESSACSTKVLGDILNRIRKLRGDDDA